MSSFVQVTAVAEAMRRVSRSSMVTMACLVTAACGGATPTASSTSDSSVPGSGPLATAPAAGRVPGSLADVASRQTSRNPRDVTAEVPAAARHRTIPGAEAFVRYYLRIRNEVSTGPQVGLLSQLSTRACTSCAYLEKGTGELVAKRWRYAAPAVAVQFVTGMDGRVEIDPVYSVVAVVVAGGFDVLDASGKVTESITKERLTLIYDLSWTGSTWKVNSITQPEMYRS